MMGSGDLQLLNRWLERLNALSYLEMQIKN